MSDRHTYTETRSELEWTISRILLQVPGVADVVTFGGYLKEVHVEVDPSRLLAHNLSLADVSDALSRSNRNVGGGFLQHGDQQLAIRGVGYVRSPQDVQAIVLKSEGGTPVTVGDVSRVVLSHTPRLGAVGYNLEGEVAEGFALLRRGENPSVVLDGIHEKVRQLNESILPKGMQIGPFYDRTDLVGETLGTVHHNLLFGALLVMAIVWLFLRSIRCSLIVASIIPLALLTAFIGLQLIHLPANLISMGAVDFGILVDGAVVLVENVLHEAHRQKPKRRRELLQLIIHSAVDVARPTFFAMAIIIAALIPVFTLQRVEGRIFRPLALTYSFALLGALVFALTVVPALCARRPAPEGRRGSRAEAARADARRVRSGWWPGCSAGACSCWPASWRCVLATGLVALAARQRVPAGARRRRHRDLRRDAAEHRARPRRADPPGGAETAADVPGGARNAERAGTPGGRHRRRGRQHERDVRPRRAAGQVAARVDEGPPDRGDARVADRDSRRQLQLLRAHQGQRRGGGQRRPRPGGAEDLRHRSRRHEDDARAMRRRPLARCRASSISSSTATRACRSSRSCSTADRWRAPAST